MLSDGGGAVEKNLVRSTGDWNSVCSASDGGMLLGGDDAGRETFSPLLSRNKLRLSHGVLNW